MFIIIDGIDGSGKGTVIEAWKDYIAGQSPLFDGKMPSPSAGNAIFDLKKYWKETGEYPALDELKSYDFIFSCEPTLVGVGKVILKELVKQGGGYSVEAIAQAFSLDRLVLYKKLLIPLLSGGKCVIQDRGVSTSLAYQTAQSPEMTMEYIASLVGNNLALEHRPDHLVLMDIKPETAIDRLAARMDKKDGSIFEKLDFLKKLDANFKSGAYQKIFTSRGTKIHHLSAETGIDIMKENAVALLEGILGGEK